MKRLPNIKLTDQELDLLIEDNRFDFGSEAIICKNNNPHSLYKIFVFPGSDQPEQMSYNKFKKINYYYHNDIKGTVKPLSTLENNGILIGYELDFDEEETSLLDCCIEEDEKLFYLQQSKELLEYYATKDITYGDVTPDNLLINHRTKKVRFCDIDNTRVGAYPIDIMGNVLTEYCCERGTFDAKADAYMHNLMTLERLYFHNLAYRQITHQLRDSNVASNLNEEAKRIVESMCYPKNFQGEYLISHIKQKKL